MVAALLADLFESHRAHLFAVAYRLTGSVTDAEDAVQESWLRLITARQFEIEDMRAWLTTVVSRICLDHLRSAATRRESYVGQWLPEFVVTGTTPSSTPDPLESVVRGQDFRLAALVVLDTLTPPQRVAFVLHDGFGVPFDEIADILDISADAARQLAVRARKAVAHTPEPATDADHDLAVRRLLAAMAAGDLQAVVAALHPDATYTADSNGTTSAALQLLRGAAKIARFTVSLLRRYRVDFSENGSGEYEFVNVNGQLGVLLHERAPHDGVPGSPPRVIAFSVRDGLIGAAYEMVNPVKLRRGLRVPHDGLLY
ncbi:sigma-70 family RNA polymerase sigma factor [Nocardia pseudobrasiliensis]|uniref:RNA polymerase sigma-70 factor (ECF subfamily) n=1 Tax=Nocardia pseudobrasiliensis TaxID=45979 RepID=A0A370HT26_9NOCA|nr:sigma-70 family RNA polymerase sigma factor [Nocardia pseudobrasiliensis]RDI61450.1 RNA polymerase sigma-70 factor (ECF subfamily) [Nocardia pseudobrasiliensis]